MSVTWEAFFVDDRWLRAVYGCNEMQLVEQVEATSFFQLLVEQGAAELERNLGYAKKVAPRAYEPLERVDLDPRRALLDIVLGRPLRPLNVEFYDLILWCVCEAIGHPVLLLDGPGGIWDFDIDGFPAPEVYDKHPYLPVPTVRRASVADFEVWTPASCGTLRALFGDMQDEDKAVRMAALDWRFALERRDPAHSLILFGE